MKRSAAEERLTEAVERVWKTSDAKEKIENQKEIAKERRERPDTLWFELILSMSTWRGSSGSNLATDEEYYSQVTYDRLLQMPQKKRIQHLEDVLLDAGVNMQNKKSRYISSHVDRIESMGGLESAQKNSSPRTGGMQKWDF